MTRRRRRSEDDADVEQKDVESEAAEESNGSSDVSEKVLKKVAELEERTDDIVNKLGLAVMDARDADAKVKKLAEKFKEIEEIADELEDKLDKMDRAESRLDDLEEKAEKFDKAEARLEELEGNKDGFLTQVRQLDEIFTGQTQALNVRLEEIAGSVEGLARRGDEVARISESLEGFQAKIDEFSLVREGLGELLPKVEELFRMQESFSGLQAKVDELSQLQEGIVALADRFDEFQAAGGTTSAAASTEVERVEREMKESLAALREMLEGHRAEVAPLIDRAGEQARGEVSRALEMINGLEERMARLSESLGQDVAEKLEALSRGPGKEELQGFMGELGERISRVESDIAGRIANLENDAGEKSRDLKEINEELSQIDERYSEMGTRIAEVRKGAREEFTLALSESETRTREIFGKVQSVMDDSQGIARVIEESGKKIADIEEKVQAASVKYEEMAVKMNEVLSKSESGFEKVNTAFRMVDEIERKIQKIIAPVDDQFLHIESFENLPQIGELGFDLNDLIQVMIKHQASDLHLKEGSPPTVRLEGDLVPVGNQVLSADECRYLVLSAMNKPQRRLLMEKKELDFAYVSPDARFRVNAFLQKGTLSASFRLLKTEIPSMEELGLPVFLKKLCGVNHGLILVTGPAGSGKSTTLASMIDYINTNRKLHVVTIEDPIEFVHSDKMSIVTQREVGTDTPSFGSALKSSLRQDPNVILIGEMRDAETMWTATMAAETGHLVLSTLHTPNTLQAIDRIIDAFTGEQQKQFRMLLSSNLRAVISQRLLSRVDGEGRIPATEILVVTSTVASLILDKKTQEIYPLMVQGATEGMQTFTASLTKLLEAGLISKEDAIYQSDRPTEFRLGVEGHTSGSSSIPDDSLMSWL